MIKYYCHTCGDGITKQEANICQSYYEDDQFCDCAQCVRYRGV